MQSRLTSVVYVLSFVIITAPLAVSQDIGGQPPASASSSDGGEDRAKARREVLFEVSNEEMPMKLFRADPGLLEQRYVAVIEMYSPLRDERRFARERIVFIPETIQKLVNYGPWSLVNRQNYRQSPERKSGSEFFRRLLENSHNDGGATGTAVGFLTSTNADEGYVQFTEPSSNATNPEYFQFRVLAPSQKLAEERAAALIQLLDRGIAEPIRQHLHDGLRATQEKIAALENRSSELNDDKSELEKQLEVAADIERAELKQLKAQQRLLDVDVAGLRARIKAAESILERVRAERGKAVSQQRRIDQLEDIKITAEIDLAGLAARRESLAAVIGEGMKRTALVGKINEIQTGLRDIGTQMRDESRKLQAFTEATAIYSRLFALKDGKVIIAPVEWTE